MKKQIVYAIPVVNTERLTWVRIADSNIFKAVSNVQENKSKPSEQSSRGLCDSGNININK